MTYLQITLRVAAQHGPAAAKVYSQFKEPFLRQIAGARSKELLVRSEDVQVLHDFAPAEEAKAYLDSALSNQDVVGALTPLLDGAPDVRIYDIA